MKIKKIDFKAFGPFTDQSLNFNSEIPGLHIIFGPNEAGKSSALRGLKALLYGFPERTRDNFIHPNNKLLVGGCLQNPDGAEIAFLRRKKRKGDLVDADGHILPSSILNPFLHSIELSVFESLYGIDHEALVEGGRDILAQKGEVGQALFAAGAGISSLKRVLDDLDQEAEQLFKARGKKQAVNQAVTVYTGLIRESRQSILSSRQWQEIHRELKKARADLAGVEEKRSAKDKELRRLARLRETLPLLVQRRDFLEKRNALGEVVVLAVDFSETRKKVEQQLHTALRELDQAENRLGEMRRREADVSCEQKILDHAELIEDLYQRLGEYRKGKKDRPRLDGMRISCRTEAAGFLKEIRPDLSLDQLEILRPLLGRRKRLQSLASRHGALASRRKETAKRLAKTARELDKVRQTMADESEVVDSADLVRALNSAARGSHDEQLKAKMRDRERLGKECGQELKRLSLWQGDLSSLVSLSLPLAETVSRFGGDFQDLENRAHGMDQEAEKARSALRRALAGIKELENRGEVPSEKELLQIRRRRDQGWDLLCRHWLDGLDVSKESLAYHPDLSLPQAFKENLDRTDFISDRLRWEADRVQQFAALQTEAQMQQQVLGEFDASQSELAERKAALGSAWSAIWRQSRVIPLSPKEMGGWLQEMEKVRFQARSSAQMDLEIHAMSDERVGLRGRLIHELKKAGQNKDFGGEELGPVVIFAESVVEKIHEHKSRREQLAMKKAGFFMELDNGKDELQAAEEELSLWQEQWQDAVTGLVVGQNVVFPEEAGDRLEMLHVCFNKSKEADDFQSRMKGIDRDGDDFVRQVNVLNLPGDETGGPVDQRVVALHGRLSRARKDQALLEKYSREIRGAESEAHKIRADLQGFEEKMAELRRLAGCGVNDNLDVAEQASEDFRRLKEQLIAVENQLVAGGEGLSVVELEAQARDVNPDDLPSEMNRLRRVIEEELDPAIKQFSEVIGEKKKELFQMDGRPRAAEAAEAAEQTLARIRRLAGRYVLLKSASGILQQEIERFRAGNQDPILQIGSTYFKELTLDSFIGLRVDEDDRGRTILAGLRPDHVLVDVSRMSSGARDQLYLALRLASLEWRLKSSEPMPFIVDDILVNFDDRRAVATLEVLARLGTKTQVILFTHHQQVAEAAGQFSGEGVVVHSL